MRSLQTLLAPLIQFLQRYPRFLAVVSFAMGVASFLMVNRQNRSAAVIAGILLASWLWLMLENLITDKIARRFNIEIPPPLLRYVTQVIHQESLFFVLPFFFVTTTWNSGQPIFIGLLGCAALVSVIDPVYFRWLPARPALYMALHTLTLFAVLLTALPVILHLTTFQSYSFATAATVILAVPTLAGVIPEGTKWRGWLQLIAMIAVLSATLWFARYWVPPATLWLTDVHVTQTLDETNKSPGSEMKTLTESQLRSEGLYAYTAIRAPRGLAEKVFHVWVHNHQEVDRIPLKIRGGRDEGYRTWSHKTRFPDQVQGKWQVRVMTEGGQLIGVVRFTVTESMLAPVTAPPVATDEIAPD